MAKAAGQANIDESLRVGLTLRPPYRLVGGRHWIADLPPGFGEVSDTASTPKASRLRLWEDGLELGPPHALHADIEREGAGRYSHWDGALRFSTRDGGDPNVDGRHYTVSLAPPLLNLLGFGSCHVHEALADLDRRGLARQLWSNAGLSYSPRETLQLIEVCYGRLRVPDFLLGAEISARALHALPAAVENADIVFIELDSPVDVALGPLVIAPNALTSDVMEPIYALGRDERLLAKRWYRLGLRKCDEAVRCEGADQVLALLPRVVFKDPELAREIVKHGRGYRQSQKEAARTIVEICEALEVERVCILSGHNMFTPDGRPMSWPVNFARELEPICRELGLPLLHSSRLVAEYGAAFSLKEDLHHFTPQFLGVLGEAMLAMGQTLNAR